MKKNMIPSILLLIAPACLLVGVFSPAPLGLRAAATGAVLALPYLLINGWNCFLLLYRSTHKLWQQPAELPQRHGVLFLNSLHLEVRLTTSFPARIITTAPLLAPGMMKLGDMFFHFLNEVDEQHRNALPPGRLAWSFYTQRTGRQPRYLDPDLSLTDNKISGNAVITASAMVITQALPAPSSRILNSAI